MRLTQKYITKAKTTLLELTTDDKSKLHKAYTFKIGDFFFLFSSFNLKEKIRQLAFLFYLNDKYPWVLRDRTQYQGYDFDYFEKFIRLRYDEKSLITEPNSIEGLMNLFKIYERQQKQQKNSE